MIKDMEVGLENIEGADDLQGLNVLLTESMKRMQIQQLIKGENLSAIVSTVISLAASSPIEDELFASAILGRLAAVARGREMEVFSRAHELFSDEPASIESLSDGDEKEYAARAIAYADAAWLKSYCSREALAIDTANNARKEVLRTLLILSGSISDCITHLSDAQAIVKNIEPPDSRIKRVRRIFDALADVIRSYDGEVGVEPGRAISSLVESLIRGTPSNDSDTAYATIDSAIAIVVRVIELRFSHALHAETYSVLQSGKRLLSVGPWTRFLESSQNIRKVQMNLLETAVVLARQNRTDKEILRAMEASWPSMSFISTAVRLHFKEAVDIDPEVSDYWIKVGRVPQSERAAEHKLGNTEDQQIGELLIQLDANRDNMAKLHRAVVPVLETFDPIQAATVRRAANGYESIAQVAERLARMRKLTKTDFLGDSLEYNPIEHDMDGGHRSGVRRVKVVRDGIHKEFGGKTKTLVKPRVEPEE
ncbi:hypothetical protein [Stenotrophomonas rhizophila]|uniref:hypothetical protein n=1 Tax=Stenotrophomonas rhizophila TaxID=216778 RepID=UPI0028AAE96F|nr:hypothetical protein [Stenotrophomonas rhizophila]